MVPPQQKTFGQRRPADSTSRAHAPSGREITADRTPRGNSTNVSVAAILSALLIGFTLPSIGHLIIAMGQSTGASKVSSAGNPNERIDADSDAPDAFQGIPYVSYDWYDVSGTTAEALGSALYREGPSLSGQKWGAITKSALPWSYDSFCNVRVDFSAHVLLPRLAVDERRLSPELRGRWNSFVIGLRIHEAGHARMAYQYVEPLREAIKRANCTNADAVTKPLYESLKQREEDYDRETGHGSTQGADFP